MQVILAHAPGRVELLGNHTDYNEGFVLSAAIDRGVSVRGHAREDGRIVLHSMAFEKSLEVAFGEFGPQKEEAWANYVLGVVNVLRARGLPVGAFEMDIVSDLPAGAGLSSSAALEVATGTFLRKLFRFDLSRMEMAKACRKAENEFVGVNCGLLDQVSSVFGERHSAISLDCRSEEVKTVSFPEGLALLIACGVKHHLVGGEYNERREQCFSAAAKLGAQALRDVNSEQLEAGRGKLSEMEYRRAAHVVGENERVLQGIEFLRVANAHAFGDLMFASHESSRVNFENSAPELDCLVAIAREEPGVYGSRLTGGGFGGSTVSLVEMESAAEIARHYEEKYRKETGKECQTYLCEIDDGAR